MTDRRYIENVMDGIGCPRHYKGYDYIRRIMEIYMSTTKDLNLTDVYYIISDEFGTSIHKVERNIRSLIKWVLDNVDNHIVLNYFGASLRPDGHITNKQFIFTLTEVAMRIKRLETDYVDNCR